jgi:hypothetical protein
MESIPHDFSLLNIYPYDIDYDRFNNGHDLARAIKKNNIDYNALPQDDGIIIIAFIIACKSEYDVYVRMKLNCKERLHNILCHDSVIPVILVYACSGGNLNVIKWLFSKYKKYNSDKNKNMIKIQHFANASENGHLKVIKWLFSKYNKDSLDNSPNNNSDNRGYYKGCKDSLDNILKIILTNACTNDHLNIVKWLIKSQKMTIEIINDSNSLYIAYANNNLEVARYLISCGVVYKHYYQYDLSKCNYKTLEFMSSNGVDDICFSKKQILYLNTLRELSEYMCKDVARLVCSYDEEYFEGFVQYVHYFGVPKIKAEKEDSDN